MDRHLLAAIASDPLRAMATTGRVLAALATLDAKWQITVDGVRAFEATSSTVFDGTLPDETPVWIYLSVTDAQQNWARALWSKLTLVHSAMPNSQNQIPKPIVSSPDYEVMVLAVRTSRQSISSARAAMWYADFSKSHEKWEAMDRGHWIERAEGAALCVPAPLRPIAARILQKLKQLGRKLDQKNWRVSLPHGAFIAGNFWGDGECAMSLPIAESDYQPVYKDISDFLLGYRAESEKRFGVSQQAYADFTAKLGLNQDEENGFLPFFLGCETLWQIANTSISDVQLARTQDQLEQLFQDLRPISKA